MISFKSAGFLLFVSYLAAVAQAECSTTWKCQPISIVDAPVLDGNLADWTYPGDDVVFSTTLSSPISGMSYLDGAVATFKCVYDASKVYFALEIPGEYRFNATDDHKCASISTMMKIGVNASFVNMGGCPDAMGGCSDGAVPDTCETYRVDIGAHWELSGTQPGVAYSVSEITRPAIVIDQAEEAPKGDDVIANKDDEYAVSPFCRFDDNDANAGNEWAGAWAHSNPVEGEYGVYRFEIARFLKTPSTLTDAQMSTGGSYSFGVAFWDPFENMNYGWGDAGHFVTGCGVDWINLQLVMPSVDDPVPVAQAPVVVLEQANGED
jgi:hypothetical protein